MIDSLVVVEVSACDSELCLDAVLSVLSLASVVADVVEELDVVGGINASSPTIIKINYG